MFRRLFALAFAGCLFAPAAFAATPTTAPELLTRSSGSVSISRTGAENPVLEVAKSTYWGAVAGLLYVYYNKYIHPTSLSLTNSAEGLLGVIAGGSGTLAGPVVGAAIVVILKNYVSTYIERWNMLLGFVFVFIVIFMPEGLVPGLRRWWARWKGRKP